VLFGDHGVSHPLPVQELHHPLAEEAGIAPHADLRKGNSPGDLREGDPEEGNRAVVATVFPDGRLSCQNSWRRASKQSRGWCAPSPLLRVEL
jgi:hypothetical protein